MVKKIILVLSLSLFAKSMYANEYTVNFEGVDVRQFIDSVSKNLKKTIIIGDNVSGTIDVKSYQALDESEYLVFFEYILTTYGYSLIALDDSLYKVIPSKNTKGEPTPVISGNVSSRGDGVVTKIIKVENVSAATLAPMLRKLVGESGSGDLSHHDASNTIVVTGRGSVTNRIEKIIKSIDSSAHQNVSALTLHNAKASEVVKSINSINDTRNKDSIKQTLVADDRTNTILISSNHTNINIIERLIHKLDRKIETKGDAQVFYLQSAKAEEVARVLQGVSSNMKSENTNPTSIASQQSMVTADTSSNSVVVIASPERMQTIEQVIRQLDIRRAQVLIEALIVEIAENKNSDYGVQWSNNKNSMVQFAGSGAPISSMLLAKGKKNTFNEAANGIKGLMTSVAFGDWNMLVSALSTESNSDILAAPSLMVLDNEEASFIVGEEVPVKTGEQVNGDFKKAFATIDRKDVGIKLKIRPQINQGRMVQMNLEQEISNVIGANGAVDVRFGKRQLNTSVIAADQQMIVLSGLIDQRNGKTVAKVPVLGDIPLLGEAFKKTIKSNERRHLMLFIKPTIIRSDEKATEASREKYDMIRGKQGAAADNNKDIETLPPYNEMINYPPEIKIIQEALGDNQ